MSGVQFHHAASTSGRGNAAGLVQVARVVVLRMIMAIDTMMMRRRARLQLQSLDDRMLKDIGVSRADVAAESCKPFWRE